MDAVGEGEGGASWESGIDICTLPCARQLTSGKLLSSTGNSAPLLWEDLDGSGGVGGRTKREGIYEYI